MNNGSLFEQYNSYSKEVIITTIETLQTNQQIIIKKKYGNYLEGNGYIYKNEESSFKFAMSTFEKRINEINELFKNGKTKSEILETYRKKNNIYGSLVSKNISLNNTRIKKEKFLELFAQNTYDEVLRIVKTCSKEEIELIEYFYEGDNYRICKKYIHNVEKEKALDKLVDKIQKEAFKLHSQKLNNKIIQNNTTNGLIFGIFEKDKIEKIKEILNYIKEDRLVYYLVLKKMYKGEFFDIKTNAVLPEIEQNYYNEAIEKIKFLLNEDLKQKQEEKAKEKFNGRLPKAKRKSLYEVFGNDIDSVIKIIDEFKVTNPSYYDIVTKQYSGEKYEIVNDIKLTEKENIILNGAKNKIRRILDNGSKNISNPYSSLLDLFGEENIDKVVKIIDIFKITNPSYYELIVKQYGGEKYEIINKIELSLDEKKILNNARIKIRKLLDTKDLNLNVENFQKRNFGQIFGEENIDKIVKIIDEFKTSKPAYYEVITKQYSGEKYEIVNDIELSKKEKTLLNNARTKIRSIISNNYDINKLGKSKKTLQEIFENYDIEKVIKVIESFKTSNPAYYEVITKQYGGEKYEIVNDIKLSKKEKTLLDNARIKIRSIINTNYDEQLLEIGNKKSLYYEFHDYSDKLIEAVEKLKIVNPNYYEVIIKKYSGEKYDVTNQIDLTSKETNTLYRAKAKIKDILESYEQYNEKSKEKTISKYQSSYINRNKLINYKPIIISNDIQFRLIIASPHIFAKEEIVDAYIRNLECFDPNDIKEIIKLIATDYPNKINLIINSNYFNHTLNYLTIIEKEYIYLILMSYTKPFLTKEKIKEIINKEKDLVNNIMTSINYDENIKELLKDK